MKTYILSNDGNTTNLYFYSKKVLKELNNLDYPCLVLGKLSGKTYAERKNDVEEKARFSQYIDVGGLSYGETAIIENYFETYGRRYGLLKEFKENCIC